VNQGKTPKQLNRGSQSPTDLKDKDNLGFTGELCPFDK